MTTIVIMILLPGTPTHPPSMHRSVSNLRTALTPRACEPHDFGAELTADAECFGCGLRYADWTI